jgi:pseudaminic acid synthase
MRNTAIALLQCTSVYPCPVEESNLRTITDLQTKFKDCVIGLSDHTLGIAAAVASVALGAKVIEKHFILDRKLGGPDAAFSLEPAEFKQMVTVVREAEKSLGRVSYKLSDRAKKSRAFCRSLFSIKDVRKGETFTEQNVRSIRPGYGLSPRYLQHIIGKRARKNIERGTPIAWNMVT